MSFFNSKRVCDPAQEPAHAERLNAITNRGKAEHANYPPPKDDLGPPLIKRLFWTPAELLAEPSGG